MRPGDRINSIYIVEQGIVEVVVTIGGKETVIERLFRGSVINYKNAFRKKYISSGEKKDCESQVTLRFAAESVIKTLYFDKLDRIQRKDRELRKSVHKFNLRMAHVPDSPLDYILSLPKKVYTTLLDRTREKMLFEK